MATTDVNSSWWEGVKEQLDDVWHQLVFQFELATAGAEDVQWVDTLEFFWDSLPDGDKLTAKEKRRIAASLKHLVAEQSHDLYHKQQSHKETISRRQEMLAQQHLELLAHKRLQQMRTMSHLAREQSMLLPPPSQLLEAAAAAAEGGLEGLLEQQQQQGTWDGRGREANGNSSSGSSSRNNSLSQQQQQQWGRKPSRMSSQQEQLLCIKEERHHHKQLQQQQQLQEHEQGWLGPDTSSLPADVIIDMPAASGDFCFSQQSLQQQQQQQQPAPHNRSSSSSSNIPWWQQHKGPQGSGSGELMVPLLQQQEVQEQQQQQQQQQEVQPAGAGDTWACQGTAAAAGLYQAPSLQHGLSAGHEPWATCQEQGTHDPNSDGSFAEALLSIQSQHSIGRSSSSSRSSRSEDSCDLQHHLPHEQNTHSDQQQQQQRYLVVATAAKGGGEVGGSRSSSDTTAGAVDTPKRAEYAV